jgi:DnaJ-class molecular chaperone
MTFETETCSRCAGTGHHSYCPMWGTVCFKCRGTGKVYTKRGQAAVAYFKQIRSKPLKEFKVGELIWMEDRIFRKSRFLTVTKSGPDELNAGYWYVSAGNEKDSAGYSASGDVLAIQGFDAETKARLFQQALDYQNSLNKQAKPYKRPKASK